MRYAGFALFEILIVCALMTLTIYLGTSYFRWLDIATVQQEVNTLALRCLQLQRHAHLDKQTHTIVFDVAKNTYSYDDKNYSLPPQVKFGTLANTFGPPSAPTHPLHDSVTFPNKRVLFHPDGSIQAGTVYMTDAQNQVMYALTCPIAQIVHLRQYKFDKGWQLLS